MKRSAINTWLALSFFAALANQSALSGEKIWTINGLQVQALALAISPSNPNIAYAPLFENGAISKTTDGGSSWTQVLTGAEPGALGVHPSNPDTVIASVFYRASGKSAIVKTTDGGKTWAPINYSPFFNRGDYLSIHFHPAYPNIIDVVEVTHLYRSSDGGYEWTDRLSPTEETFIGWYDIGSFQELTVDPRNPDLLFCIVWDWIYKSTDGGYTWSGIYPFIGKRTYVTSLAINPKNSNGIWASTTDGIAKTVDGGTVWKLINSDVGNVNHFATDPIVADNMYATVEDRVKRSTDGGVTWSDMSEGLPLLGFISALSINPRNPQLLYAATPGGVYTYSLGNQVTTLHFPRVATKDGTAADPEHSEYTGIGIVNVDSENAGLTFTAYSSDGTLISGDRITNPAMRFLRPGEQIAVMDGELWGEGWAAAQPVGWFTVDSTARITGFFLTFNQSLSMINGTSAGPESFSSVVLTEIADRDLTRIHVANPNAGPASVSVELVDRNGQVRGSALRKIEPHGVLMELVGSLFPGIACEPWDYLRLNSDQAVTPFEVTDRPGQFTHALNGQDSSSGATTLYCPQYVAGGSNWNTSISIVNPSSIDTTAMLRLIGDNGTQIGPARTVTIPSGGKTYVSDPAFFLANAATEVRGFVAIESIGPSAQPLIGSMGFGDSGKGSVGVSLPLVQALATDFVFSQIASDSTWWSGIAMVNPNDAAATVTLELLDGSGSVLSTTNLVIPAGQRISGLLSEYFGEFVGKEINSGYIHAVSDRGVAAFAALGTHTLSAITAVPAQSVR